MYSRRLGLLSVLSLCIMTCAFPRGTASQATQIRTPDTPAGRQLAALLQALNTPDAKTIRAFVEKHIAKSFLEAIPLDEHVAVNSKFAEENGGLAEPTPLQLALARGDRWLALLESGEVKSLRELARREGVDSSYVSRMVNMTTLAPDIAGRSQVFRPGGRAGGRSPNAVSCRGAAGTLERLARMLE